jgi:tetratricopeptide (TPR) repeat protein
MSILHLLSRYMVASTTNLDKCYQLLGICHGASLDELKTAYRALARKWHPDLNPGNVEAHQRFITIDRAYRLLLDKISSSSTRSSQTEFVQNTATASQTTPKATYRTPQPAAPQNQSSKSESELKWQLYYELQSLLKQQQFLKAIVLIEGLVQHSPQDSQIYQWQGIIYSQFGYKLIERREFEKASIYLRKALKVDPHNRQLWEDVDRAFNRIYQLHGSTDRFIQN